MLFNPSWRKTEEKQRVFTLARLAQWLETKPADESYDWHDVFGCVLCQFLHEVGGYEDPAGDVAFGPSTISDWGDEGYYQICGEAPWTFGAALERARAVLAAQ